MFDTACRVKEFYHNESCLIERVGSLSWYTWINSLKRTDSWLRVKNPVFKKVSGDLTLVLSERVALTNTRRAATTH